MAGNWNRRELPKNLKGKKEKNKRKKKHLRNGAAGNWKRRELFENLL